jgi:hypothetical protein
MFRCCCDALHASERTYRDGWSKAIEPSGLDMGERQKHEAAAPKASCGDLEKVLFLKSVQSFNNGGLILRPVDRRRVVADDQ